MKAAYFFVFFYEVPGPQGLHGSIINAFSTVAEKILESTKSTKSSVYLHPYPLKS